MLFYITLGFFVSSAGIYLFYQYLYWNQVMAGTSRSRALGVRTSQARGFWR